jgi:hypothetical protein
MLYILQSWKESLSIYKPKNFKLFLLVTLKSALELFGNLIYFFWWLMLATFVFLVGGYYPAWATAGMIWFFIGEFLLISLVYVWFMLVRPSVLPKGYAYFKQHIKKTAAGFVCIYFLFNFARIELLSLPTQMIIRSLLSGAFLNPLYVYMRFRLDYIPFIVFPPFVCAVLFYFDSDGGVRSWFLSVARGFVMYIYNFPFCFLSMVMFFIIWCFFAFISYEFSWYILWLFVPVVLSYFKTMYVKRLHDQFNLYFANE